MEYIGIGIVIAVAIAAGIIIYTKFKKRDSTSSNDLVPGTSKAISGKDHIDVSGMALVDHAVKLVSLLCVGAGDAFVYLDYENDTRIYGPRPPKKPKNKDFSRFSIFEESLSHAVVPGGNVQRYTFPSQRYTLGRGNRVTLWG